MRDLRTSLGLAPLANIKGDTESGVVTSNVLEFIYNNMNQFYGFKALHHCSVYAVYINIT